MKAFPKILDNIDINEDVMQYLFQNKLPPNSNVSKLIEFAV